MQSIVEVVYGSNKTYNSVYTDPSFCKMVIVQDDDKFPPPRLCLLRRWPNFEGGFGFNLYEGELNSSGALKVEEVVRHSPAEAGGLRKNDVIIEINGENIELKSFFPLVEILKEACSQAEMELLVLAEQDAQWYRVRNITVNSNFPNIEYCETPYYGHILKPIESAQHKSGNPQFEIHSGTGKVYRTTLLIDKEGDSVYKKIEELDPATNAGEQTIPPLRPDGTFRHPGSDNGTVRVYYRRDRNFNSTIKSNEFDSGHGTLSNRRSTPLSTNQAQNHYNTMSPYSTLGKSYGDSLAVDLLHDKWADLMDKYLDNKFRSSSKDGARVDVEPTAQQQQQQQQQQPDRDTSATRRTHVIRLNDPNATVSSKRSRSRCQSPNDASFSYLYSGRDDYQTASATSFRDLNSLHRGSPQTQSYNRYNVQSPNRVANRNTSSSQSRPHSQQPPQDHTITSSSTYRYDSSMTTTHYEEKINYKSRETSPLVSNQTGRSSSSGQNNTYRATHNLIVNPVLSNQLGFQLDENEVKRTGVYFVKHIDQSSPSELAGLKEGDKITKINGKSTLGMPYEQFCEEIIIAQQQQMKNNMIHLMVMRKSAKSTGTSSYTATSSSNLSSTSIPIRREKSSSFVDEGYGHDSPTLSTTTATAVGSKSNLVSVINVSTNENQASSLNKTPASVKPATITEIPPYVAYESSSYSKINSNVIYDSQEAELLENSSLINKPQHSNTSPIISSVLAQKQERELREKLEREKIEREQQEKLEKERLELRLKQEREERERLERLERERLELRLKQEREERDRFEREKQERFERELKLQQEREEREREERERERIERERRELERIRREKLERERLELEKLEQERVEREKELERKRQEQEERDRIEREEFLKQLKEREERERNERELERERLRAESEKRLREIMERDERERKEREQLFFASQQQPQQQAVQSDVKTALAALTTIVVTGSEPEIKRPIATTDEIITTTTINEIHEIKHEVVEEELIQKPVIYEQNKDVIETYNTQTYDDASDTESQSSSEEEKARRQFAEQEFARQQEVMKHLVLAMEKPKMKDKLKTYNVYNSQHFFGYGIAFHTEHIPATLPEHKLVYPLVEIEQGSPSDEAGMRNGQRVVAVNGKFVNNEISTLEDVVQEIEDSYYARSYTEITVVEPELWSQCMENPEYAAELANWREVKIQEPLHQQPEQPVSAVHQLVEAVLNKKTPEIDDAKFRTKPRLVQMSRNLREDQYGFDFKTIRHEGRHVANNVKPESIADRAGLRNDDIILEVNGELVHGMEHDAVVKRISSNPFRVDLLVIADPNSYFLMVGKTEEVAKAEQPQHDEVNIDLRVPSSKVTYHRVNLDPNFKGLGISLTPNGIISNIEPGSPSDKAGLKKDHKIVEVNGIDVRDKSNKDIASLIKQNEGNLVIGVIDTALGQNINADVSQTLINAVNQQAQIAEAQVVKEYDENIILTNKQALTVGSQSVSSATGKKLAGSIGKLSGSQSNLTYLKSKFGSCLGLGDKNTEQDSPDLNLIKKIEVAGTRVCNMVTRPDYNGFGFSIRGNDRGPHQVSAVEPKSPAEQSGLKVEDLILKVNDLNVVGERYSKTVTLIKNESDKGRLKLEVIDQKSCPKEIREVTLVAPSGYSTVSASYTKNQKNKKFESTQNLRDIAAEIVNSERSRSVDTASDRNRARPYSMTDIDRVPVNNSTIRSIQSVGSTATGYSQSNLANVSSKSAGNLTQIDLQAPKFKRCVVQLIEGFTGYGFTLNSKVKPKYMIFTVDPKSPAYAANLRSTDVIVEIDRKNIRRLKFDKVRQMLSDSVKKGQVEILAISKEGYMYYKNKKKNFSSKKLVSLDNTEPYSTLQGIQTRDSSVNLNTRNISSDNEGDRDRSVGVSLQRTSTSPTTNRKEASQSPSRVTGTDLDLYDIIQCTVTRRPDGTLGLSLSPQKEPRSLSRSSGIEDLKSAQTLPVISNIEPNSPAEESGLRVGDTVLEINGKSTSAQPNSTIVSWIKTAGKQIDFTVSREKKLTEDDLLKQNAKHITDVVIENALSKLPEQKQTTPVIPARRLSRKDSASLSSSKVQSQQNSPLLVNSEIRMSSSKLYQADLAQSPASSAPQSPRVSPRNQSEPAPIINELNKSLNQNQTQSSPISRRSSSSYTLPRDAPIPRLCRVRVYEDQLGFTIAGSKSSRGIFKISEVTPNSSAAHSGLLNDDYIIEISGVNVESMSYSDVVDLLRQKKLQDDLQLLVVDRQTLEWYKSKKIPISSQIVPKMQYIETLLKEELEKELEQSNGLNNNDQLRSSQKGFKIPYQSGRSVWIKRRIYLCGPPVNTRSYSSIDLSDRNN